MHTDRLGKQLLALCTSREDKLSEVKGLLETLTVDQRREVVRYKDEVSASCGTVDSHMVTRSRY